MCVKEYVLKTVKIKGILFDSPKKRPAIVEFLGKRYNENISGERVIYFKDKFGHECSLHYGEYLYHHPIMDMGTMGTLMFDELYEPRHKNVEIVNINNNKT